MIAVSGKMPIVGVASLLLVLILEVGTVSTECQTTSWKGLTCGVFSDIVHTLFEKIREAQVQSDHNLVLPPLFWKKKKGIYGSDVKLNFHGSPTVAMMRDSFKVFDNNMFATAWITSSLVEGYKYGKAPKPTDEQIGLSIEAIGNYHDKNREQQNAIMTFWPEAYNESTTCWQSAPGNLLSLLKMADFVPWTVFEDILKLMGLTTEADYIKSLIDQRSTFARAFHIPPDFDDTFVNLGLGALLAEFKDDFPQSFNLWMFNNANISTIFAALKSYAYRPFSNDSNVNTIDARTYFYMRGFLEEARSSGSDVALIPTWVQNLSEDVKMTNRGVGMPFNINNVDVTVSANSIFGITSAFTSGLIDQSVLDDLDIEKIYANTSSMLVWEIERDFIGRRDLALTYYPSIMEFYWFISRTYALLERQALSNVTLPLLLENVRISFGRVLKNHVSWRIINSAIPDSETRVYYDDFLGNGDVTAEGTPEIRGEDRIFTTTMAVNALVNTWSVWDKSINKIRWLADTPWNVSNTVQRASTWLTENTLSGNYKPWNAFFSGSGKGFDSLPFWYPFNRLEHLNGTKLPLNTTKIPSDIIFGFQGVVSPEQYDVMLNQTHFGMKTPLEFKGYNDGKSYFPFWSSESYTYATTMLALSQASALLNNTGPAVYQ